MKIKKICESGICRSLCLNYRIKNDEKKGKKYEGICDCCGGGKGEEEEGKVEKTKKNNNIIIIIIIKGWEGKVSISKVKLGSGKDDNLTFLPYQVPPILDRQLRLQFKLTKKVI